MFEDDNLLKKYNTTLKSALILKKTVCYRPSYYNKRFLKTKIKSYDNEIIDFYNKEIVIIPV